MSNFEFGIPQQIFFCEDVLMKIKDILEDLKVKELLIISDPQIIESKLLKQMKNLGSEGEYQIEIFSEIEPNPSIETVKKAAKIFQQSKAKLIIAVGGGSSIDTAKAAAIMAYYGEEITKYEGIDKIPGKIVSMIAIPTTAGTGSESTGTSVITDTKRNYKFSIKSSYLLPAYVILAPELLASLPPLAAASTGIDALVHAIEAYISKESNLFTDIMAEKAMDLIGKNIRRFVTDRSDMEAAENMMLASNFAGIAFHSARLGIVHAMAHPVSGFFHTSHGIANAILLPICMQYNEGFDKGKYKKIYHFLTGKPEEEYINSSQLANSIWNLLDDLGIPKKLSDVKVTEDKIPSMADDAMKSGNIQVNPRQVAKEDILALYYLAM